MAVLMMMFGFLALHGANSLPEQGVFTATLSKENGYMIGVHKSMYKNSLVAVKLECSGEDVPLSIDWLLRRTPCAEEYVEVEDHNDRLEFYRSRPEFDQISFGYKDVSFKRSEDSANCKEQTIRLKNKSGEAFETLPAARENKTQASAPEQNVDTGETGPDAEEGSDAAGSRKRRDASGTGDQPDSAGNQAPPATAAPAATTATAAPAAPRLNEIDLDTVYKTWEDGIYLFIISAAVDPPTNLNLTVTIWMKGTYGYLSAIDWPLLPFYGVMCVMYLIYGIVWLVLSFCNWRDLLRIQFWIGGVIFLGMLEKAVFFAEYEKINSTGQSVRGAVVFAELVSCMKRTLARMLVVIVSLGFGIVKPRLGPMLHRVLGMGALYMILGSVEGILRVTKHKSDTSQQALLASIPLAVLDAAICWWVFTSLVQTTRTLRLRRNLVKLSLYRHFTNTLIFAVLASVAFMIWSIKQHKMVTCLSDWKEIWVDDAFWHLLFSVILLVIMVLWRPTANNQRYAFSPLLDAADDEAEEPMLNDAFDGMKMRSTGKQGSTSPKQRGDAKSKADEDLKWIEENIPTSVTDTALPSLLDSDEEIMTTKFEMSKME